MRPSVTDSGSSGNIKHKKYQQKLHTPRRIIFQLQKTKNNEKMLKESREKTKKSYFRGTRITADFSLGTMQARREEWNIESAIRKKTQLRIQYLTKLIFKRERELMVFSKKNGKFITSMPVI